MRILFIFPPARVSNEVDTFRALDDVVVTTVGAVRTSRPSDITIDAFGLPWVGSPHRWAGALAWYIGLGRVSPGHVDLVVSHEMGTATTSQAQALAKRLGVPHLVIVAQIMDEYPLYRLPPWRWWIRRLTPKVDAFLCITEAAGSNARHFRAAPDRVHVVSPGIDTDLFAPAATLQTEPVLSYVGELRPDKGILEIVEACDPLAAELDGFRLIVAGDGPLREQVKERAKERPWMDLRGHVPRERLPEVLREARAMAIAPWSRPFSAEQFGFALVEAMSCGLPIVSTACGAIPTVVPDSTPLPDEHDVGALTHALRHALGPTAERVGPENRRFVLQNYSLTGQAVALRSVLEAVLQESRHNPD